MRYDERYYYDFGSKNFTDYDLIDWNNTIVLLYDKEDKLYRVAHETKDVFLFCNFNRKTGFKTKRIALKHFGEKIRAA